MNSRFLGFIALSIIFAGAAVLMARNWLEQNRPTTPTDNEVIVVSLSVNVPAGTVLEQKHLKLKNYPTQLAPTQSARQMDEVLGMVTRYPMLEGEPLRMEKLAPKGEGSVLASLIEQHKRAVTIRVNDVVGVAGFLLPGNRVDVLLTYERDDKRLKGLMTEVVLSNLKVLAVDQLTTPDSSQPMVVRAVTLEVSLDQAETLMSARRQGTIQLALRNPNDESDVALASLHSELEQIVVEEPEVVDKPKPAPVAVARRKVEVIRGVTSQTITVD